MSDLYSTHKSLLQPLQQALFNFESSQVLTQLNKVLDPEVVVHLCFPFETMKGVEQFYERAYAPLLKAIPDLERRETIVMSGSCEDKSEWVGFCGYYTGSFEQAWLEIPATGHQVAMRFHEFYRIENNKVIEIQAIWDIPEVMMQASVWPMVPSLGREWHVPGPSTQDGLAIENKNSTHAKRSLTLVSNMLSGLGKFASGGVEAMQLEKYWHQRSSWYGPSGIGTGRGIQGFRNWHQIPFLSAMPNRTASVEQGYIFAEGDYVGFTAWPGMSMHISDGGWLGIAPANQKITMRSLDFWRCENNMIRENWVLVDLLHVYHQLGVDVLARMREFNKSRR
ncbi:polyketide cyclase [Pseudoalteromonas sp. NBT06-2]|uniref:ester cyclase n=1 Tax=Pseudoalteromonas sp. NBT06-2 TaxID=2025950 RepID=UPI000BA78BD9|nr:ester cyclase [Pseudoalteromonas sp. NBT06-2]PAJ76276.1 polyketide cyclase [Pseudoalteromonas sp. NBT06-2]